MSKKELVFIVVALLMLLTVSFVAASLPGIPEVGPAACAWHQNNNPNAPRCDESIQRCSQGCPPLSQNQAIMSSGNNNQQTYQSSDEGFGSVNQKISQIKRRLTRNAQQESGQGSRRTTAFKNCLDTKTDATDCDAVIQQCKDHLASIQSGLQVFAKQCLGICRSRYDLCRRICGSDSSCFKYQCTIPGSICTNSCKTQLNSWWPGMETSTGQDAGNTQLNSLSDDFRSKCKTAQTQGSVTPSENTIPFSTEKGGTLDNNLLYDKLFKLLKEKTDLTPEELSSIEDAIKTHQKSFRVRLKNVDQDQTFTVYLPNDLALQNMVVKTARPLDNAETTITVIDDAALHKALPILGAGSYFETQDYTIPEPSPQNYDLKQTFRVDTKITPTEITAEDEAKYLARKEEWVNQAINKIYEEEKKRVREIESGTDEAIKEYYLREKNHIQVEPWLDDAIKKAYKPEILNHEITQEQKDYQAQNPTQKIERWLDDAIKKAYEPEILNHEITQEQKDYQAQYQAQQNKNWIDDIVRNSIRKAYEQDTFYDAAVKKAYEPEILNHEITQEQKQYPTQKDENRVNDEINKINAIRDYYLLKNDQKERIIQNAIDKKAAHTRALVQSANRVATRKDSGDEKPFSSASFSYTIKDISQDEAQHAKLLRYDDSKKAWTALPTQVGRCESGACHFVSESPGTSYFAIVIEKQTKSSIITLIRTLFFILIVFSAYRLRKKIKTEKKTLPPSFKTRLQGALWAGLLFVAAFFTAFIVIMLLIVVNQTLLPEQDLFSSTDFITALFLSLATLDFLIYKRIKKNKQQIMLAYGARDWLKGAMTGLIFAALTHLYSMFF